MGLRKREDEEEEKLLGTSRYSRPERRTDVLEDIAIEERALDDETHEAPTWRNLPHKKQLLLLSLCRLSTPLSNACLIPYLYFLVKSIISDPEHPTAPQQISRLTGLLVAAFPIGQMVTSMLWGRLSDTYGRRPAILLGLGISIIANIGFGFSRTLGMLVFWRVVAGMANGIVGVMRTMTAEIVKDRKHRPRAFLAPPVVFNSGRVVALAVGGCLADPVDNLPFLFGPQGCFNFSKRPGGVHWAVVYPYALPALFNGIVLAICWIFATLWLRESLQTGRGQQASGVAYGRAILDFVRFKVMRRSSRNYTLLQDDDSDVKMLEKASQLQLPASSTDSDNQLHRPSIWTHQLCKVLVAFALLPLHNATFLHIFPILLSMPIVSNQKPGIFVFKGGLGLASPTIGLYLALFGITGIILQLFIYPRIHQRIDTIGVFRLAHAIFPIAYILAPYLALLTDYGLAKWFAMAAVLFTQIMARTMAIPSSVLLLTDAAPHRSVLGTVHGAGNTLSALASACGPAIGGVLLAKGIEIGAVGLVWWAWLCAVSLVAFIWSFVFTAS